MRWLLVLLLFIIIIIEADIKADKIEERILTLERNQGYTEEILIQHIHEPHLP